VQVLAVCLHPVPLRYSPRRSRQLVWKRHSTRIGPAPIIQPLPQQDNYVLDDPFVLIEGHPPPTLG
jgi:hypothetical protein